MSRNKQHTLSTAGGTALYIGALLGPAVLLLPGLALTAAGPASVVGWGIMLALSAIVAVVFARLGIKLPGRGGVAAYVTAGLGTKIGRAVGWCFLAGVIAGAPMVCMIGGGYVSDLLGGGSTMQLAAATLILAAVIGMNLAGTKSATSIQLALVSVMIAIVAAAVIGSAHTSSTSNWTPFMPHGWTSIGSATSLLMLSIVGWEAVAPMTPRLRDPRRQLPRIIAMAFTTTAVIYLALAAATVGVLGGRSTQVPIAALLNAGFGQVGTALAAAVAVVLTLSATNAYLTGGAELAVALFESRAPGGPDVVRRRESRIRLSIPLLVAIVCLVSFTASAAGWVSMTDLVAIPTALFLTVYLGAMVAAVRLLPGLTRVLSAVGALVIAGVLVFSGWSLVLPAIIIAAALVLTGRPAPPSGRSKHHRDPQVESVLR